MGVTVKISALDERKWRELQRKLKELGGVRSVRVGVLAGSKNSEGQSIAEYAAMNEFGGTVTIPARQSEVYFKMKKNGNVGNRFVKKSKSNFAQSVVIPAHTVTIPARPFMRTTAREKGKEWANLLARVLNGKLATDESVARRALTAVGRVAQADIQATIMSNMAPPNSPAYAASKKKKNGGYSGTLFLSGDMHKSINFELVTGAGESAE